MQKIKHGGARKGAGRKRLSDNVRAVKVSGDVFMQDQATADRMESERAELELSRGAYFSALVNRKLVGMLSKARAKAKG